MALSIQKGTVSATAASTTHTISLPAGFAPKAIFVWTANLAADGSIDSHAQFCNGFGTYDGGAAQQWHSTLFDQDAAASETEAYGHNTNSILAVLSDGVTPTVDSSLALTSMSDTSVVLTWSNPPGANMRFHYLVLGGSDITAARVGTFTQSLAVATQDVTINAGFGQPDLLFFDASHETALGAGTARWEHTFSAAKSATDRFAVVHRAQGGASMITSTWTKARAVMTTTQTGPGTVDSEADLADKALWPTDGFRLSYVDQASQAQIVAYLALKGTFTSAIHNVAAQTVLNATQDLPHGSTPRGAIFSTTTSTVSAGTIDQTGADISFAGLGAYDGTNEGHAGFSQDDGAADSFTGRTDSTTKAVEFWRSIASAPAKQADADASISGDNVRLTWTDPAPSAYRFMAVTFGDAVGGGSSNVDGAAVLRAVARLQAPGTSGPAGSESFIAGRARLLAGGQSGPVGSADLAGVAGLQAAGLVDVQRGSVLRAVGGLAVQGHSGPAGAESFHAGAGRLSAAGEIFQETPFVDGALILRGVAGLTAAGLVDVRGAVGLAGVGRFAGGAEVEARAAAVLRAQAQLAARGQTDLAGAAALAARARLLAAGHTHLTAAAVLAGRGTLAAGGQSELAAAAVLAGAARLTAAGQISDPSQVFVNGAVALAARARLIPAGTVELYAGVALAGAGSVAPAHGSAGPHAGAALAGRGKVGKVLNAAAGRNPGVEGTTPSAWGWQGTGATGARVNELAIEGSWSWKVTMPAGLGAEVGIVHGFNKNGTPVSPGEQIRVAVWVYSGPGGESARLKYRWGDLAADAFISETDEGLTTLQPGWQRLVGATRTVPDGVAYLTTKVVAPNTTNPAWGADDGFTWYADDLVVARGADVDAIGVEGRVDNPGTLVLAGAARLSPRGTVERAGAVALQARGRLSAGGAVGAEAETALRGAARVTASGLVVLEGAAALAARAQLGAAGTIFDPRIPETPTPDVEHPHFALLDHGALVALVSDHAHFELVEHEGLVLVLDRGPRFGLFPR